MTENNNRIFETFRDGSSLLLECNVKRIDFKRGDRVLVTDPSYWFDGTEHQYENWPSSSSSNAAESKLDFWTKYRRMLFGNGHNGDGREGLFTYTFSPASRERVVAQLANDALAATKLAANAVDRVKLACDSWFPFAVLSPPPPSLSSQPPFSPLQTQTGLRIKYDTRSARDSIMQAIKNVDAFAQTTKNVFETASLSSSSSSSSNSNNNNIDRREIKFLTVLTRADGDFKVTTNGGGRQQNSEMNLVSGKTVGVDTGTIAIALLDDVLQIQPNALNHRGDFRLNGNAVLGMIFEVTAPKASVYVDSCGNIAGALQCLIFDDDDDEESPLKKHKK